MSVLAYLIDSAVTMFCHHEWCRRAESGRLYLECLHCRTTTPGICPRGPDEGAPVSRSHVRVHAAEAA